MNVQGLSRLCILFLLQASRGIYRLCQNTHCDIHYNRACPSFARSNWGHTSARDNYSLQLGTLAREGPQLSPSGRSIRDSNRHTSTEMAFCWTAFAPFRGEEKPPESHDNPKAELSDKLTWTYSPAPYLVSRITLVDTCISPHFYPVLSRLLCYWA